VSLDRSTWFERSASIRAGSFGGRFARGREARVFANIRVVLPRGGRLSEELGDSVARRHLAKLDRRYLHESVQAVCEVAEDLEPQRRLDEVLRKASSAPV
jgi:hypothetical protein